MEIWSKNDLDLVYAYLMADGALCSRNKTQDVLSSPKIIQKKGEGFTNKQTAFRHSCKGSKPYLPKAAFRFVS